MTTAAELSIRVRRAAFNRAIAEGDLTAIQPLLAPDVVMVTGSDSAVIGGRKAQLAVWKREFAQQKREIYVRTPESIVISAVEPLALETGQWDSIAPGGGMPSCGGSYSAKWREVGEHWVLEAEIFVTLR
jgi:ketosteroid isomerase-like protein